MCSRQCYSCLLIQYIAVSYFTAEMHKSNLVQSIRTEQTRAFFVRFLFHTTVLHHFEDLMELTAVYSFEQSRGDGFGKDKKKL